MSPRYEERQESADLFHDAKKVDILLEMQQVDALRLDRRSNNEYASLRLVLDADLRGAFSWNTKQLFVYVQAEYETPNNQLNQVVLWDVILQQKVRDADDALYDRQRCADSGKGQTQKATSKEVSLRRRWPKPKESRLQSHRGVECHAQSR